MLCYYLFLHVLHDASKLHSSFFKLILQRLYLRRLFQQRLLDYSEIYKLLRCVVVLQDVDIFLHTSLLLQPSLLHALFSQLPSFLHGLLLPVLTYVASNYFSTMFPSYFNGSTATRLMLQLVLQYSWSADATKKTTSNLLRMCLHFCF